MNQVEWFLTEFKDRKQVTSEEIDKFYYASVPYGNNPNKYYYFMRFLRLFLKEKICQSKIKVFEIDWEKAKELHPDLFKEKKKAEA